MSRIIFLFLSILFLGSSPIISQDDPVDFEDPGDIKIVQYSLEQANLSINDIEIDQNNRVLVATDKALFSIGSGNKLQDYYLVDKQVNCVTSDNKLNIYAAGDGVLYLVSDSKEVKLPATDVKVKDIAYKTGKLWLATNQGIFSYTLTSGNWKQFTQQNSKLKSNLTNNIRVDDQDVIWIGTEKGYIRIKNEDWDIEDKGYNIVTTRSNKEGQWMIATDDMWLIDPYNRKYPIGLDQKFHSGVVNDFVIDSKGRVYIASDILVRYNPYTEEVERYGADVGMLSQKCLSLACDKNNNIWIGTADAGLFTIVFDDIAAEQLVVTPLLQQGITCDNANDAIIKLSVAGGTRPYKYKWSDRTLRGNNPSGVKPGTYAVTVTDKNDAEIVSNITVTQPEKIVIEVIENRRITDTGSKDGRVEIAASGGTGALTVSWSNGKTGYALENIGAGNFTATVKDENGCQAQRLFRVKKEKYIPELDISKVIVGQKLRINELNFKADSTNIDPENFEILDEVYEFMKSNSGVIIEIGGHTNTVPSHEYCDRLSTERAKSVFEYIVERGVVAERIKYKGYGKREPLTESTSRAGKQKNQRVEVTILAM